MSKVDAADEFGDSENRIRQSLAEFGLWTKLESCSKAIVAPLTGKFVSLDIRSS